MKKNLTSLLQKGNLTPKERCQMFVQNVVTEEREGKGFLSDADKYALVEGWHPKDNYEIREYNKYNGAWRTALLAEIDAQTAYLRAQNAHLRAEVAATYYMLADGELAKKRSNKDDLNTILENTGLIHEYVTYRYAFDLMDGELRQDLLKLYPDIETESDYLTSELALYELLGDKGEATDEAKDEIADLISKRAFNKYAAALAEKKPSDFIKPWSFHGYFADIPLLEVAKKWAEYEGIDLPDKQDDDVALEKLLVEKITGCAEERKTSVGELIKRATRKWLDEGLLEEHAPLFLSDKHETVNDASTKLPHKAVFKRWLEAKTKAEQKIQQMIDDGELETRIITDNIFGIERKHETILGKSLYPMKGDYKFVTDYKNQAEAFMPVGTLFDIIKRGDLMNEYALLLGFQDIFARLSKIYDVDLTEKVNIYLEKIRHDINMLNDGLRFIKDKFGSEAYMLYDCRYFMDAPQANFVIDPDGIEPAKDRLKIYYDEFEKVLGDEFGTVHK
ncbi:hypothetical protein FBR07_02625 [Candidatus Uhrbacteria bacterium UHB]|nr:hypothetical protein [Candidatus Uhrbacteria bacterium UHB]RIL00161.1 MAG: hypothetical protein DCC77_04735 [Candidatus Uhrbacteria bacterium]